jgi:Alginate export
MNDDELALARRWLGRKRIEPVPNTAGRPGAYTGSYGQVRLDWTIDRQTSFAVEAVHFAIGDALRNAGGHDSNYLGVEIKRGW